MAGLIVACARTPYWPGPGSMADDVRRCATAIAPDNIQPNPPLIQGDGELATAVVNPGPGITAREGGVCVGRVFDRESEWWRPGPETPDGTYVIARWGGRELEMVTDTFATRQLWYVHTPDLFLASTSQRALVMLLRSFELDQETVTWMLATGYLGGRSWDSRLRRMRGDSRLVLDRETWMVQTHERPAVRGPLEVDDAEHVQRLKEAILDACAALRLPHDEWLLPLSGGLDSRMLLLGLLEAGERPRCVTWGVRASLDDATNDAYIARELAKHYGLDHTYWPTDATQESIETAMRRFLAASEGQVYDFNAYTDGMAMWKGFFEDGIAGIIRGDEPALGYFDTYDSETQILRRQRVTLVSEYPAGHPIHALGLAEQHVDARLRRNPGESLAAWSSRLAEEWFYQIALNPLNTIKAAYVEIVNPMQSRRVAEVARRLPDHLRSGRKPLREIVAALGPDLPEAKTGALQNTPAFWGDASGMSAMVSSLSADEAERVLTRPALDVILAGLARKPAAKSARGILRRAVKGVVPGRAVHKLRPVWPLRLGGRQLAFRAYVAVEMAGLLSNDAGLLERHAR